ncbi:MAG: hypothetical protein D6716_01145, partial [Chloroflexi bacterium]
WSADAVPAGGRSVASGTRVMAVAMMSAQKMTLQRLWLFAFARSWTSGDDVGSEDDIAAQTWRGYLPAYRDSRHR